MPRALRALRIPIDAIAGSNRINLEGDQDAAFDRTAGATAESDAEPGSNPGIAGLDSRIS
jgi:hypothetical protein